MPSRRVPHLPIELGDDEERELNAHLNLAIAALWEAEVLRRLRRVLFADVHAQLEECRQTWDALSFQRQYWMFHALVAGYPVWHDPYDDVDVPVPQIDALHAAQYARAITKVLQSANLFDPDHPEDNKHYRVLAAHLLVWPDEIHEAEDLPEPYPLPLKFLLFLRDGRLDQTATVFVAPEPHATARQRRLADKILAALHTPGGRLPYGAMANTDTPATEPSAARLEMKANRLQVAEVVARLLDEDPLRNWDDVLENDDFRRAQEEVGTFMHAKSNLTKLMNEYKAATGWTRPPRPKRSDRPH